MAVYNIGDEFIGSYPPECAHYLNETQIGHIEEVEPGVYKIIENVFEEEESSIFDEIPSIGEFISVTTKRIEDIESTQVETDMALCELYEMILGN